MDKWLHLILYWACDYFSMLGSSSSMLVIGNPVIMKGSLWKRIIMLGLIRRSVPGWPPCLITCLPSNRSIDRWALMHQEATPWWINSMRTIDPNNWCMFEPRSLRPYWAWWYNAMETQKTRFMGLTWDPPGSCRSRMGPMLAPWTWLSEKKFRLTDFVRAIH